ncbi:MAG: hypothetical protein O2825_11595, partial [Proteobacteria bacterium]|nr:hypothetical protein [Pseudomonadota bacterium]
MPYPLPASAREWQQKMRVFVDERLIPWEVHAEMNDGFVPQGEHEAIFAATRAMGLYFPSLPREGGGAELTKLE